MFRGGSGEWISESTALGPNLTQNESGVQVRAEECIQCLSAPFHPSLNPHTYSLALPSLEGRPLFFGQGQTQMAARTSEQPSDSGFTCILSCFFKVLIHFRSVVNRFQKALILLALTIPFKTHKTSIPYFYKSPRIPAIFKLCGTGV